MLSTITMSVHSSKLPFPNPQGTKAIMKDVAKYLPGIGWSFMFMEYPLLKRDWKRDEERLAASCRNLADYPINMLVSSVVSENAYW